MRRAFCPESAFGFPPCYYTGGGREDSANPPLPSPLRETRKSLPRAPVGRRGAPAALGARPVRFCSATGYSTPLATAPKGPGAVFRNSHTRGARGLETLPCKTRPLRTCATRPADVASGPSEARPGRHPPWGQRPATRLSPQQLDAFWRPLRDRAAPYGDS